MAKNPDRSLEKAEELVEMIADVLVDHEDVEGMITLANLHLQVSIAQSLRSIQQDGIWISSR